MTYAIGLIDDKFDELLADYSWTLKGLRLTAEEVSEGCDFRGGRHPLPLNNLTRWGSRPGPLERSGNGVVSVGPGVRVGPGREWAAGTGGADVVGGAV